MWFLAWSASVHCRRAVADALGAVSEDVTVQCTDRGHSSRHIPFRDMLHAMERSIFALALPGNAAIWLKLRLSFWQQVYQAKSICFELAS